MLVVGGRRIDWLLTLRNGAEGIASMEKKKKSGWAHYCHMSLSRSDAAKVGVDASRLTMEVCVAAFPPYETSLPRGEACRHWQLQRPEDTTCS